MFIVADFVSLSLAIISLGRTGDACHNNHACIYVCICFSVLVSLSLDAMIGL